MEYEEIEEEREIHQKVTAKISEFSNEFIHIPGEEKKTEYLGVDKLQKRPSYSGMNDLKVFVNGKTKDAQGFVSITFDYNYSYMFGSAHCTITVIDTDNDKRFSRTFSIFPPKIDSVYHSTSFGIDKYISRQSLLTHSDNVLPNDVLTLMVDFYMVEKMWKSRDKPVTVKETFESSVRRNNEEDTFTLLLDSPIAKCLSENSTYFESVLHIPMRERDTKMMRVDNDEYASLERIAKILMQCDVDVTSVKDIFNMYILANKYDIPVVSETCTCFLKLCLVDHTVDEYIELANEYENEGWKEIIMNEINLLNESKLDEEIEKSSDHNARLKLPVCGNLWRYVHLLDIGNLGFVNLTEESRIFHEKENFEFYR